MDYTPIQLVIPLELTKIIDMYVSSKRWHVFLMEISHRNVFS